MRTPSPAFCRCESLIARFWLGWRVLIARVWLGWRVHRSVRKVPYETVELLTDLVTFAARQLVVGGRLVYWLATTRESCVTAAADRSRASASVHSTDFTLAKPPRRFHVDDIPLHPALRLIVATPQVGDSSLRAAHMAAGLTMPAWR